MKKIQINFLIIGLFLSGSWAISQETPQNSEVLSGLIREAIANNPRLEAAVQRSLAAKKAISQAGALPDPKLTLGLMNLPVNSFAFDQEPMTGKQISIMQMFPFPGKQSLATTMAEHEATAVGFQRDELQNQLVQMVKVKYFDLFAVDRALETVEKNRTLMEQFVRIAEAKYATGRGLQQDVLRAQVELSKLEDDLIMWRQKRLSIVAMLNGLLNRPADTSMDMTFAKIDLPEKSPRIPTLVEIEKNRPLMKAWLERIKKTEAAVGLAQKDLWPNFTIGAGYSQRNDLKSGAVMHDFFSATFSLNIPVFKNRKQKAKIAQKTLDLAAVRSEYANVISTVLAEIESLRAELERHRKRVELYKWGILLQAQQSLESAQAGYQVGKVDFLTLINNWMMLQNYELQHFLSLANYFKTLASFEFTIGKITGEDSSPTSVLD